jgi:hypothetical protein
LKSSSENIMHLTPEQLIDLAEDAGAGIAVPHLKACEVCRQQVVSLRAMMSAVAETDVPQPSPLFWDHLSHRVREAVDRDEFPVRRTAWWAPGPGASWRGWAMAGVAAAVTISLYVTAPRTLTLPSAPFFAGGGNVAAPGSPIEPFGAADDPALLLFADLTEQIDSQTIAETGWSSHPGAVDEAVTTLTVEERATLQRLLNEELTKS